MTLMLSDEDRNNLIAKKRLAAKKTLTIVDIEKMWLRPPSLNLQSA